jgi:hypothetical protein
MSDSPAPPLPRDRINHRLPAEVFGAIDSSRAARAGHVSRNTWLTEAVQEKLAREGFNASDVRERRHG